MTPTVRSLIPRDIVHPGFSQSDGGYILPALYIQKFTYKIL